ncbi:V-set and immunoglobulin domain-containing protein 10-like [Epinephelus lanceolatus]
MLLFFVSVGCCQRNREMNTPSFGVLFIFTALSISKGNEAFISLQCMAENVGVIGQQSLLECVVKSTQGAADPTIRVVTWRKVGDERPLLVFRRGQTELQPQAGYMFAEPSWNGRNMNVSLLITNTSVEHEGVYTCMVITDSGDATSQTSLKVTGALSVPSVSVSPSAEIVEGSSVTLTCSSDANPAANYTWYKKNGNPNLHPLSKEPQLVFSSIQSSDSGEYYCTTENELGRRTSESIAIDVQLIQGQKGWRVTYTSTEICAVKGSTVEIHCSYRYPSSYYKIDKTFWFVNMTDDVFVDLKTDPQYSGRVQYVCDEIKNDCTLRITDLRESDSAVYKFRFITNQPGGQYYGKSGVTLSVTDLKVSRSSSSSSSYLQCHSSRYLPVRTSYIWYKNGQKIKEDTSPYVDFSYDSADSYSCAVKGCGGFPSPSVLMNIIRLTLVVLVLTLLLLLSLWTRKKKTLSFTTEPQKPVEIELKSCPVYENVSDAVAQTEDTEEQEDLV